MRPLIKSLLISFVLYILYTIIGIFASEPLARGWYGIVALPILAVFMVIGIIIGLVIERIKSYKPEKQSYVLTAGLICAFVGFLLASFLPKQNQYLIFGSPNLFYWSFYGFVVGAIITFIIEKIKKI